MQELEHSQQVALGKLAGRLIDGLPQSLSEPFRLTPGDAYQDRPQDLAYAVHELAQIGPTLDQERDKGKDVCHPSLGHDLQEFGVQLVVDEPQSLSHTRGGHRLVAEHHRLIEDG